ncbi:MAG: RdgB/HAM1 family non-canonical purine NTP pyrophosphatase [Dehalococcoidia bacterium]|nr:RdgB/HAM1 family non-canonical purine NTP pyrophosphatase [Dehalococcoidia bacterium]
MRLLVGTGNPGKVREFRELLDGLPVELVTPADIGLDMEVEETGDTLEENALIKAQAYANAGGILTLADDSGLFVDALDGAPGVISARYGAPDARTDEDRVQLLLRNLVDVPDEHRGAAFRCVIVIAEPNEDTVRIAKGELRGIIRQAPRGTNGFGYDPIFVVPEYGKTVAELDSETKNALSHRGRAASIARDIIADMAAAPKTEGNS